MSYTDDLRSYLEVDEDDAEHYGTPRRSGRYPYGSGGDRNKQHRDFLSYVDGLKKSGLTDNEIWTHLGITSTKYRQLKSIAKNELKAADIAQAQRLRDKGMGPTAIGKQMGIGESSVRALLEPGAKDRAQVLDSTKEMLKDAVDRKKMIDVGGGVEHGLGVSYTKLKTAVSALEDEGYKIHYVKLPQGSGANVTHQKVLTKGDVSYSEVFRNRDQVQQINGTYSDDGGRSWFGLEPPLSISSKRIQVVYGEDGGGDRDGMIFVRPGVKDVELGGNLYAQVRVMTDKSHFLKGMAAYKDDLPDGVDVQFHTGKTKESLGTSKKAAFKELKRDPETGEVDKDNPFGAVIDRQIMVKDSKGNNKVTSAMNIVNETGDWDKWSRNLSSQMLSKQSPLLAKRQLDLLHDRKREELDEIESLTNPAVKRKLLEGFADSADSASVHLKAAPLPDQATKVLMPVKSLKPTEVYAPSFKEGDRVALVRFPHGGKFEIPEVIVNNRNREARKLLGTDTPDAIGIHPDVAKRLSGADFDGDTVLVIPNNSGRVRSEPALRDLANFDPQRAYPKYEGMDVLTEDRKQQLMGDVSNLITDMTIKGATHAELAQAVRHSMVIIDATKHELNHKLSAEQNGIAALKKKYQARDDGRPGGASTIVSRKKSPITIPERRLARAKEGGPIDKETGRFRYVDTGNKFVDPRTGKTRDSTQRLKKLEFFEDANDLRGTDLPIERIYADHSNRMKDLAREARKVMVNTKNTPYSQDARKVYQKEVDDLNEKLTTALRNRPLERQALVITDARVSAKRRAYPDMSASDLKKVKAQALAEARTRTGARKQNIEITDREWEAIQAGAITNNKLEAILRNTDLNRIKELATPRTATVMTSPKQAQAKALLATGYTPSEVAEMLGVNVSTLRSSIAEEEG